MRKLLVTGIILSSIVTIGGATGAFAGSVHSTTSSTIEYSTPKTEKSNSVSTPAPVAPTPTAEPVVAPEPVAAPAPVPVVAPAPAPVPVDPNYWTDDAGNRYYGPVAISCANGSAPVVPIPGFPPACF